MLITMERLDLISGQCLGWPIWSPWKEFSSLNWLLNSEMCFPMGLGTSHHSVYLGGGEWPICQAPVGSSQIRGKMGLDR